jgi:RNase H-fold protein (predicted Holliday junction resolvase)
MQQSGLPIERSWEVWSSIEAGRFAGKGHEHDDASAAAFILQRFLDMRKQPVGVE